MAHEMENTQANSIPDEVKPAVIMRNFYSVFPSYAMLAGMQLDVFTPLGDGPMDIQALASALRVREEKLSPLLYSLVAAGLLEVKGGVFSNTDEANVFLVRDRPRYIGGLAGFFGKLWEIALKTGESVRTGEPQAKLDFHSIPEEELLVYFQKQFHSSLGGGKEIAEKYDFSHFERLLDAGGGSGGVSIALCSKYPRLKATVADLPKVARLAERFIADAGMSERIGVTTEDLRFSPPAGKHDIAVLRALIQTLSREDAQKTLECVGRSLLPGGRILIFGNVLDNSRMGPPASLAYGLVFLNSYDHGSAYTEDEYRKMLATAGFGDVSVRYEVLSDGMCMVGAVKK